MIIAFTLFALWANCVHGAMSRFELRAALFSPTQGSPLTARAYDDITFWTGTDADPEIFAEVSAIEELESSIWEVQRGVQLAVYSPTSMKGTVHICYCQQRTITATCTSCIMCSNQKTVSSSLVASDARECETNCDVAVLDKVYNNSPPADFTCPMTWFPSSIPVIKRETVIYKLVASLDYESKFVTFKREGMEIKCNAHSGICAYGQGIAILVAATLQHNACAYREHHTDVCDVYIPRRGVKSVCPKVVCPNLHDELFLTGQSAVVPLCAGGQVGSKTVEHFVIVPYIKVWVSPKCTHNASMLTAVEDFQRLSIIRELIKSTSKLREDIRALQSAAHDTTSLCPSSEVYAAGRYMIEPMPQLILGRRLMKRKGLKISTTINGSTVLVYFQAENEMRMGFLDSVTMIVHDHPCGPQLTFVGIQINTTSSVLIHAGTLKEVKMHKYPADEIRMIKLTANDLSEEEYSAQGSVPLHDLPTVMFGFTEPSIFGQLGNALLSWYAFCIVLLLVAVGIAIKVGLSVYCRPKYQPPVRYDGKSARILR